MILSGIRVTLSMVDFAVVYLDQRLTGRGRTVKAWMRYCGAAGIKRGAILRQYFFNYVQAALFQRNEFRFLRILTQTTK